MTPGLKRLYKPALLLLAAALLVAGGLMQSHLNRLRTNPALGLTRSADLGSNAPPALAFTTMALGGFRGLIANALWIRANDLQMEGKFFEMVQLADWITKLEPHFVHVWIMQAWNMAYNISVKFSEPSDRWRWVQNGIELLRDHGLRYNPREALLYRELGWFFQHKMGQNLDNAHVYYKLAWITNMTEVLGTGRPDFDALISPTTDAMRQKAALLREHYKIDAVHMREVDREFGPLEWRLPEAHAIYWAALGLKRSKPKDLITLRRVIYQSMHQTMLQGRLIYFSTNAAPAIVPNLEIAEKVNAAYERMIEEDKEMAESIRTAHRNFLRETTYLFYSHNRIPDAQRFFDRTRSLYPGLIPADVNLDDFAIAYIAANIQDMTRNQLQTIIEGLLRQSFVNRAMGENERADGYWLMARIRRDKHVQRLGSLTNRLDLPPLQVLAQPVLDELLDPQRGLPPDLAARLRTSLNLPPPATTNASPPAAQENK